MSEAVLSLLSGLVGAIVATFVTLFVEGSRQKRQQRLSLLTDLVAYRNDVRSEPFTRAMNGILAVFADAPEVLRAHEDLYAAISQGATQVEANDRLIRLWRAMAKRCRVSTREISDAQFCTVMNPRDSSRTG